MLQRRRTWLSPEKWGYLHNRGCRRAAGTGFHGKMDWRRMCLGHRSCFFLVHMYPSGPCILWWGWWMPESVLGFPFNIPHHPTLLLSFPFCLPFWNSFISYPLFFFIFPLLMLMRIVWGTLLGWISHGIYVLISLLVWGLPFFFASIIIFCNKCLFHFLYFPLSPGDLIYKRYFSSCTLI